MQVYHIVFIFELPLSFPDVDGGVGNLASVAARKTGSERMTVINEEVSFKGNNEIWLMVGKDWAGVVERFDIKVTCLRTLGS